MARLNTMMYATSNERQRKGSTTEFVASCIINGVKPKARYSRDELDVIDNVVRNNIGNKFCVSDADLLLTM